MKKILATLFLTLLIPLTSYASETKNLEIKNDDKWTYISNIAYKPVFTVSNLTSLKTCMDFAENKENLYYTGYKMACVNQSTGYIKEINCKRNIPNTQSSIYITCE